MDSIISGNASGKSSIVDLVIPIIMGTVSIDWAIIIAVGVNNISKFPKGPCLYNIRYTTKPTKTGGNPIPVFKIEMVNEDDSFFFKPNNIPTGIPINDAIITAELDISIYNETIPRISDEFKRIIKLSIISSIIFTHSYCNNFILII